MARRDRSPYLSDDDNADVARERVRFCFPNPSEQESASDFLYRHFRRRAIKYGVGLTHNFDDAEDLLQESFARMSRYYKNPSKQFGRALKATMRRAWSDEIKRRRRFHRAEEYPDAFGYILQQPRQDVVAALMGLPWQFRAILRMRVIEGRSCRETGAELGIAPNTVRARQKQALRLLAERLEKFAFKGAL